MREPCSICGLLLLVSGLTLFVSARADYQDELGQTNNYASVAGMDAVQAFRNRLQIGMKLCAVTNLLGRESAWFREHGEVHDERVRSKRFENRGIVYNCSDGEIRLYFSDTKKDFGLWSLVGLRYLGTNLNETVLYGSTSVVCGDEPLELPTNITYRTVAPPPHPAAPKGHP